MFFRNLIGFVFAAIAACKAAELRGSQDLTDPLDRAAVCKNTAHRGAIDRGCTENLPLCVSAKGRFLPLRHFHGGMCARCVNLPRKWPYILWRRHGGRDFACPSDRPICLQADYTESKVWFAGMFCIDGKAPCYNSNNNNNNAQSAGVDYKCTTSKPMCVKADGSEPALHSPGDQCVDRAGGGADPAVWHVYTTNADFDNNNTVLINVDMHTADQLDLKSSGITSRFLWIPDLRKGYIIKIDTDTGRIVGRYQAWPYGVDSVLGGNPMAVSVDLDGSVWVANIRNRNSHGTITHIGLEENGQCEDRNGNGSIETSTGMNDMKAWTNDTGTRGVATADDECIVHFVAVTSTSTNQINVNQENDVWVSGYNLSNFDLVKGGRYDDAGSGIITKTYDSVGYGGSAGLIDGNGVVWSSLVTAGLMRWSPEQPLNGTNGAPGGLDVGPLAAGTTWAGNNDVNSLGLCFDSMGNVWNTVNQRNGLIRKFDSDGRYLNTYGTGGDIPKGCVVDRVTGDLWIANSGNLTVGHLRSDGTLLGTVRVGQLPTAVAIDRSGKKIWVANIDKVMRIDPALNGGVGGVDLTIPLTADAAVRTVSDLSGSTLTGQPSTGTWTITHDSDVVGQEWGSVTWNATTPSDSTLTVVARSSNDGITYSAWQPVTDLVDLTVPNGRYLQVRITFQRSPTTQETPILYDLSIRGAFV